MKKLSYIKINKIIMILILLFIVMIIYIITKGILWNFYYRNLEISDENNDSTSFIYYAKKAYQISELYPQNYYNMAYILNFTGIHYSGNYNFAEAEKYLFAAKNICEKYIGTKTELELKILNNIGTLYLRNEDYRKAENYMEEAMILAKKKYGEKSIYYSVVLSNRATVRGKLKKVNDAIRLSRKSIEILDNIGEFEIADASSMKYAEFLSSEPFSKTISNEFEYILNRFKVKNENSSDYVCYVLYSYSLYNINFNKNKSFLLAKELDDISSIIHKNNDEKRCEMLYYYAVLCDKLHEDNLLKEACNQIKIMTKSNNKLEKYYILTHKLLSER